MHRNASPRHSISGPPLAAPAHNKLVGHNKLEHGDNVKVICRVRPFNDREKGLQDSYNEGKADWDKQPLRSVVEMEGYETVFLDHHQDFMEKERFKFDESIWSIPPEQQPSGNAFCVQEDVMRMIGEPTIRQSWGGYNTCIFAYGQTGAGKTHTMMGTPSDLGLIPRMCQHIFASMEEQVLKDQANADNDDQVHEYRLEAKFLEIYNEHVKDLLWDLGDSEEQDRNRWDRDNLKVRNIPGQGPYVVGLTNLVVTDWDSCMRLIQHGTANRTTAATKMNEQSSRSHSVFKLVFTQTTKVLPKKQFEKMQTFEKVSSINLVDLAGSERTKKSGAQGDRLKEAAAINKSLTTLKNVIDALVEGRHVIPYRESQLTWLLSENLGGNSKTFMVACVSPHIDNADETLNTLRYALRTQGIQNRAQVNMSEEARKMARLKEELENLQAQMAIGGNPTELQREFDEGTEMLKRMQDSAKDHEREEEELRKAVKKNQEMKFAAAYHNAFRVMLQKKLMEKAEEKKHHLGRRFSHARREAGSLTNTVSDEEQRVIAMLEEEEEALGKVERAQRDRQFWKEKSEEMVELQAQLLNTEETLRLELEKKQAQRDLATKLGLLENEYIRTQLDRALTRQIEMQDSDLMRLRDRVFEKYQQYGEDHAERIRRFEADIHRLKNDVAFYLKEYDLKNQKTGKRVGSLEEEQAFLERESITQSMDWQHKLQRVEKENSAAYFEKQRVLQKELEDFKAQQQEVYTQSIAKVQADIRSFESEGTVEKRYAEHAAQRHLSDVDRIWGAKFDRLVRDMSDRTYEATHYNEEMQMALKDYRQMEPKYKRTYDKIMMALSAEAVSGSGQYVRLVEVLRSGTLEAYHSVIVPERRSAYGIPDTPGPVVEDAPVLGSNVPNIQISNVFPVKRDATPTSVRRGLAVPDSHSRSSTPGRGPMLGRLGVTPSPMGSRSTTPRGSVAGTPRGGLPPHQRAAASSTFAASPRRSLTDALGRKPDVVSRSNAATPTKLRSSSPRIAFAGGNTFFFSRTDSPSTRVPTNAHGAMRSPARASRKVVRQ